MQMERTKGQCLALLSSIAIKTLQLISRSLSHLSSLSNHPLFSFTAASSLLAALYLPRPFLPLLLSPVLISTVLLLAALLSLCSPPPPKPDHPTPRSSEPISESQSEFIGTHQKPILADPGSDSRSESKSELLETHKNPIFFDPVIEWGSLGGPLKVIYEEYEGEEDHDDEDAMPPEYYYSHLSGSRFGWCTDSDDDSDGSPEMLCFRWEEDDEAEGMIEIELEEDNLIEIDISGDGR